ncbi:MAG TPA: GAF domain-containing protein [Archangium sp.]|jgi:PAS domain S-box-containing protein|uniref:GAF domain-containing protein n=1 Tax=Archangium sp. TaxID=1872627 RepID=UPI002EDBAC12
MAESHLEARERLRLCDFIREHTPRILAEWERELRGHSPARALSQPRLLDHLPHLLNRVANVVETVHTGEHQTLESFPEVHALERLEVGYDLEDVSHEYAVLRECVLRLYEAHAEQVGVGPLSLMLREVRRFNQTFDEALSTAVSCYARTRERTLMALDRLSEAALGTEELETFLPKLLRIILESTESVDCVALLLRDGEVLRMRAAVGGEQDVAAGFSLRIGEGFAGKIAAERRPLEVRSAATDSLVKSPALRAQGTRALYGVPVLHEEAVIGVAHMGSRTAFEFSNEDKLLFRAMVIRVTGFLVQAQLVTRERQAREASERMLERVRAQEARTARLQEVTAALSRALTTDQVARVVVDKVARALGAEAGSIGLLTEDGQHFEMRGALGYSEEMIRGWERIPADSPVMFREAVRTGALVLYETRESFLADYPQWANDPTVKAHQSFATLPLLLEDRALGALGLSFRERHSFTPEEQDYLRVLAGQCAQALERGRLYDAEQRARAEAQRALARLNLLMDTAPVGLGFWDEELRYVHINGRLAEMNGLSEAAHLGRTVREVLPELAPTLEPLFREVLETGLPRVLEVTGETPAAPGVERHWLVSYYPVRDVDGTSLGLGGVVVEITDRKRVEEELRRTAEFRERFLGIVSHDLRNPLNAILLSANTLMHSDSVIKQHLKTTRRIATSAERMARMIADLLDFTRGRLGGGIPVTPRPADLRHICRHVVEELELVHPERTVRLRTRGDFQGEWDPDRVAQLLGNLGKNALDYSRADSIVDFVLHDEGDTVRVEIHNEGAPIPAEQLPHIFEPFRRATVDGGRPSTSGLGLGLFIVHQIVRAHGGTIEARSTEAEGTTIGVRLPRRAAPAGES